MSSSEHVKKKLLPQRSISKIKEKLASSPNDLNSHCLLLSHYYQRYLASKDVESYIHQLRWFIESAPEHSILRIEGCASLKQAFALDYKKLKQVWINRLKTSPQALAYDNAAAFFLSNGELSESIKVLSFAKSQYPENPHWLRSIARVYMLSSRAGNLSDKKKALECYVEILEKFDFSILDLAEATSLHFQCGKYSKAKQLCLTIMKSADNTFDESFAIHMANTVLGQIALRNCDTSRAISSLHASLRILHPILLCIRGINFHLAKELVERGHTSDVLSFLRKFSSLCPDQGTSVDYWYQAVKVGKVPKDWLL